MRARAGPCHDAARRATCDAPVTRTGARVSGHRNGRAEIRFRADRSIVFSLALGASLPRRSRTLVGRPASPSRSSSGNFALVEAGHFSRSVRCPRSASCADFYLCHATIQSTKEYARAAAALLIAIAAVGCGGQQAGGPQAPPPTPVKVATVHPAPVADASELVATIKSLSSTTIHPQMDGQITRIFVKSGDRVKAGTPLLQIDPQRQQAAVASQDSARAAQEANVAYAQQQLAAREGADSPSAPSASRSSSRPRRTSTPPARSSRRSARRCRSSRSAPLLPGARADLRHRRRRARARRDAGQPGHAADDGRSEREPRSLRDGADRARAGTEAGTSDRDHRRPGQEAGGDDRQLHLADGGRSDAVDSGEGQRQGRQTASAAVLAVRARAHRLEDGRRARRAGDGGDSHQRPALRLRRRAEGRQAGGASAPRDGRADHQGRLPGARRPEAERTGRGLGRAEADRRRADRPAARHVASAARVPARRKAPSAVRK